jgi:hypothetical protein
MQTTRTTLAIDMPTFQRLADLARKNERSASAEARIALRRHLESSVGAQPAKRLATAGVARGGAA